MPAINKSANTRTPPAVPVRKPFADWTLPDAKQAVAWVIDRRLGREGFLANWAYAQDHDHLQNLDGWIGPLGGAEMVSRSRVRGNVERQFTPVDTTAEVLDNLANALLQNRAQVALEPLEPAKEGTPAAKTEQDEAKATLAILLRWAEDRGLWMKARDVVKRSRWATWATLRAWIPESAVAPTTAPQATGDPAAATSEEPEQGTQQTGVPLPTGLTLKDALGRVYLAAPVPDQGFVYVDPDTQRRVGIFLYADDKAEFAELVWINEAGLTVFKTVSKTGDEDEVIHDLGRRLTLNQMEAELLVTAPVRQQQAQLNFAQSILTRVMETAGFAERYVIDAMPEGELTDVAPTNVPAIAMNVDDAGKQWYIIPKERTLGAAITTDIRSMIDPGPNSSVVARQAAVVFKEPTDPAFIIHAADHARATILRQCKQGHLVNESQAQLSGFAYVQARSQHLADVTNMRDPLVALLRETLEAVLAYAALMSTEAAQVLARFRVVVTVHITLGPVSPEERAALLAMLAAGALSLPTTLTLLQVDDVAAELERIRSQPESQRATLKAQAELGAVFIQGWGLDAVLAAKLAGLTEEQVRLIQAAGVEVEDPRADEEAGNANGAGRTIARTVVRQ